MHKLFSPGAKLRAALKEESPLQIVGVPNAYTAKLAAHVGYRALYLSGAGIANACHALPDLGMTSLDNVVEETRRITDATDVPLLVDVDTGWGHVLTIARAVQQLIKAGAAGMQIEDQVQARRCGHRSGKQVVSVEEMVERIKAAVDARTDPDFVIMARTDAFGIEDLPAVIERAKAYVKAGADMVFPEALPDLKSFSKFTKSLRVPVLANMTEFGVTPLFTREELQEAGVELILYPLSAFRAMSTAALLVFQTIRKEGHQHKLLEAMQTRQALYEILEYEKYERELDKLRNK